MRTGGVLASKLLESYAGNPRPMFGRERALSMNPSFAQRSKSRRRPRPVCYASARVPVPRFSRRRARLMSCRLCTLAVLTTSPSIVLSEGSRATVIMPSTAQRITVASQTWLCWPTCAIGCHPSLSLRNVAAVANATRRSTSARRYFRVRIGITQASESASRAFSGYRSRASRERRRGTGACRATSETGERLQPLEPTAPLRK